MQYKFFAGIFFFITIAVPASSVNASVFSDLDSLVNNSALYERTRQLQLETLLQEQQRNQSNLQQTQSNQATINRLKLQYGYAAYGECMSTNFDWGNQYEVAIQLMAAESCMANYRPQTQREQQTEIDACKTSYGPYSYTGTNSVGVSGCKCLQGSDWGTWNGKLGCAPKSTNQTTPTQTPACTANATYNGSQCICNTGYFSDSGACITGAQSCINNYGSNSVYNSADNSCDCVSGFVWDSGQTACVKTAVVTPTVKKTTKNNSESASVLNGVTNAVTQTDSAPSTNVTTPRKGFWSRLFHALNPFSWF